MSDRLKVTLALVASALLHLCLLGVFMLGTWLLPASPLSEPMPELKTVEVTLQPMPMPTPVIATTSLPTAPKMTRSVLDTEGLAEAEKPPDNPIVESDRNSVAASDQPPTGDAPLPSQEGKERPFAEFATQDYSLGPGLQPRMQVAADPAPTPVPVEPERAQPAPAVTPTPTPPPADPFAKEMEEPPSPTPTPANEPLFTPTPVPNPAPNAFALGKPTPVPVPNAQPTPTPPDVAMLATKPRQRPEPPAEKPGYQPQKQQTKIEGNISNRGRPGVDAIGTPLGRYRKAIADAIGSRWYQYVNDRMDLIAVGDVHIRFAINEQGQVQGVKILSNTANSTFGEFCVRSVTEAKIPPLPPDVASKLDEGRLEIEYHFTIYPQ